ncbi:MAG: hypothetical protein KC425_21980, partial [Anaerolineales bacterium]|nr:hypothetical protein [Anaerolineales bacterium]
ALAFAPHNLYTARELAQMVPLAGAATYARLRQANAWADALLPNAASPPPAAGAIGPERRRLQRLAEWPLRSPAGARLEQWEMRRKLRKFAALHPNPAESAFSADCCKGHVDSHAGRILAAYQARIGAQP